MLVSLEALAMAGASDVEFGMDIEEWERKDLEEYPPPHLLAQEEEKEEGNNRVRRLKKGHVYGLPTTHFLPNHNAREYDEEEENGVTFTNIQEKMDRTVETTSQCARSMKIMARALKTLIMFLCYMDKRFRRLINARAVRDLKLRQRTEVLPFAMAGMDYMENAINVRALEQSFNQSLSPEAERSHCSTCTRLDNDMAMEWVKMKMREWAIAVASDNHTKADLRVSEILLIMDSHHLMHSIQK
ncbi:unnamed protein product [Sphenostylis stenocarpa]|uniref:Uncharacterized protein n=1 Tax=Sphenostylis stenocarpa TaxID=92480 RepID=A0AA86RP31_9FABA|nr:unnamed protein product [Sphenostylis stenocarpa]